MYCIIIFRWHNPFYVRCPDPPLHERGWRNIFYPFRTKVVYKYAFRPKPVPVARLTAPPKTKNMSNMSLIRH